MITALSVSAAAQTQIWMFWYDFVKGLIDTEESLSFRNRSQSFTINRAALVDISMQLHLFKTCMLGHRVSHFA